MPEVGYDCLSWWMWTFDGLSVFTFLQPRLSISSATLTKHVSIVVLFSSAVSDVCGDSKEDCHIVLDGVLAMIKSSKKEEALAVVEIERLGLEGRS